MPDTEDGRVVIRIVGDDSNFNQALNDAQSNAQTAGNNISGSFNNSVSAVANATRAINEFNSATKNTGQGAAQGVDQLSGAMRDAGETANTTAGSFQEVETQLAQIAGQASRTAGQVDDVSAAFSEYCNGLDSTERQTEAFTDQINGIFQKLGVVAALAAAAKAVSDFSSATVAAIKETAAYGDTIDKTSQKIGISAEAYQEWDAVLQHSGADIGTLVASMRVLSQEAEKGGDAFKELGISEQEIAKLSQEELFSRVIEELQGMEEGTKRTYLAQQLLGRGSTEFGALLNTSAEETQKMKDRVHELNGVMSDESVKAAAAFQDQLQDMNTALSGLQRGITNEFLPSITAVMSGLTEIFAGNYEQGKEEIAKGIESIIEQFENLTPEISEIGKSLISTLGESVIQNAPELLSMVTSVLDFVIASFIENAPLLIDSAVEMVNTLAKGISENLPLLIPSTVDAVLKICDTLLNNVDKIIDAGFTLLSGLADGLIQALPVLIGKAPEIITKLATELITLAPKLVVSGVELLTQLFTGLLDPNTWGGMPDDVAAEFENAISEIKNKVVDKFTDLGHDLWQALIDGWEEYFNRDFPKWEQWGADIYNELHDGTTGSSTVSGGGARGGDGTQGSSGSVTWQNALGVNTNPDWMRKQTEMAKQSRKNTEEQTAATEKSTEALDDNTASLEDNKKAFDEWYAEQEAALAQGKISEDEFIRNLDAKLNSASEYAGTAYTKFWNKVNAYNQKAAKEAERQAASDAKKRAADEKTARDALIKQGEQDFNNALADYRAGLITREQFDQEYARLQNEWKSLGISDDMSGYTDDKITDQNRDDKKKALQQQQQEEKEAKKKAVADAKEQFDRLRDQLDDGIIDREQFNAEYAKLQKEWSDNGIDITEYTEDQIYDIDHKARQKSIKDAKDAAKDELETLKKKLDAEQSEYKSKLSKLVSERDNLEKSLNGGILSVKSTTDQRSGATYKTYTIANLDKKIAARRQLGTLLSELVKKGIPKSLLSEIASADPEDALAYAKTLSSLSEAKWEDIKADYKAFEEANKAVAEAVYAPQIEALNADFKGAVGAILESASGEAQEAGAEFISAFLKGADLTADDFPEQFKGAIDTMTDTVKKSIEDGDISKSITSALDSEAIGEDIADGIAEGISSNADVISDAIEDAVNRADPDLRAAVDIVSSDRSKAAAEAPAPTAVVSAGTTPGTVTAAAPTTLNVVLKWKDGRTLAEIVNTENRNITIQGGTT